MDDHEHRIKASQLTSMCNRLVSIGILDAVVLENGEYGYIVTTLGLNYYSTTPANDPVARLLASMMLATLNS